MRGRHGHAVPVHDRHRADLAAAADDVSAQLLLITGSTRSGSTNTAALRTAAELLGPEGATLFDELGDLPAFNPDDDHEPLPSLVASMRARIDAAAAVVFCTPEYAGTLPGSFKNLLDWTVGGGEIYGKPTTWINIAASGRGEGADQTLRVVLGYVGARIMDSAGLRVEVPHQAVAVGLIADPAVRASVAEAFAAIVAEQQALPEWRSLG
jgi:chromate reductase, NAD(P)H dehydrogenase (quinone)